MPLSLYKRGNVWHIRGTVAGREIRRSTGATDRKIAERVKAEIEARAWQRRFDGPGAGVTMADVFSEYLDAGKPERFLLKLVEYWKETAVEDINSGLVRKAAKKLYPGLNPASWNRQVVTPTQAAINHAAELGWCNRIHVTRFPVDPKEKTPATAEWVLAFHDQAIEDGLPHLAALCVFMFGTAARVGESCRMLWRDIDLHTAEAKLHLFKPKPWTRTFHLPPEVIAALANIPSNRKPDEPVFGYAGTGSVKIVWKNVCKRAGIDHLTPHCCRHGFATTMLQAGWDVKTVANAGGWKDAATVLRTYAHAINDKTVTNDVFRTQSAQAENENQPTIRKKGKK